MFLIVGLFIYTVKYDHIVLHSPLQAPYPQCGRLKFMAFLFVCLLTTHSVQYIFCSNIHSRGALKPISGHISKGKEKKKLLPLQLSNARSSSVRGGAWRSSSPSWPDWPLVGAGSHSCCEFMTTIALSGIEHFPALLPSVSYVLFASSFVYELFVCLVSVSICVQLPCFCDHSLLLVYNLKSVCCSSFVLFVQDCFGYLGLFVCMWLLGWLYSFEQCSWHFDTNYIESVNHFSYSGHFNNMDFSNPWTLAIFQFASVFLSLFNWYLVFSTWLFHFLGKRVIFYSYPT